MNETNTELPNGIGALNFTPFFTANVILAILFAIFLSVHVVLTIRYWRYYGYALGMLSGLLLELLGCVAKVKLSHNRADKSSYIMYIIGLTLGPTFLSSSLYLSISLLQRRHGEFRLKPIRPRLFSILFIVGDFICLCFIGIGGSLAAIYAPKPIGVDLMIAGLASQVLWTTIFWALVMVMYFRSKNTAIGGNLNYFVFCTILAALCLFIRSCWRVAELSDGFNGPLASKEGVFIALDSVPIIVMSALLTLLHPGLWFGDCSDRVAKSEHDLRYFKEQGGV